MKAKYITTEAGYEELTLNEVYDVEDVQCEKKMRGKTYGQVEKIQIKNGEVAKWYEAKYFELYAEATAAMPVGMPAGMSAAMPLTIETKNNFEGFSAVQAAGIINEIASGITSGITSGIRTAETSMDTDETIERIRKQARRSMTIDYGA